MAKAPPDPGLGESYHIRLTMPKTPEGGREGEREEEGKEGGKEGGTVLPDVPGWQLHW